MRIFIRLSVIVVILGLIAMIPMFTNWDSYTAEFEQKFKKDTGFDLKIDGGITFKMFPKPNLYLKDVRVGNLLKAKEEQVEIVNATGVHLRVKYFPLFFKMIIPIDISLYNPRFYVKQNRDGEFNISKFFSENMVKKEDIKPLDLNSDDYSDVMSAGFNFNNLSMDDGVFQLDSEKLNGVLIFDKLEGKVFADSVSGPFKVDLKFNYKGSPYKLDMNSSVLTKADAVKIDFGLFKTDDKSFLKIKGAVKDSKFEGSVQGEASSLYDIIARFKGDLDSVFETLNIPVVFNFTNLVYEKEIKAVSGTIALGVAAETGKITRGRIEFTREESGKIRNKLEFASINTAIFENIMDKYTKSFLDGSLKFDSKFDGEYLFISDVISHSDNSLKNFNLRLSVNEGNARIENLSSLLPGNGNIKLSGELVNSESGLNFNGNFDTYFENVSVFLKWIGHNVDNRATNTVYRKAGLKSNISGNINSFRLDDLAFRLDNTDITGNLVYQKKDGKPFVTTKLETILASVDPYISDVSAKTSSFSSFVKFYIERISGLLPFEYSIDFYTKSFVYRGSKFNDFTVNIENIDNKIEIKNLSSSDVGGMDVKISGGIDKKELSLKGMKAEVNVKNVLNSDLTKFINYLGIKVPNLNKLKAANAVLEMNGKSNNLNIASVLKSDMLNIGINGNFSPKYNFEIDITHPSFKNFLNLFEDYYYPEDAGVWFKFRTNVEKNDEKVLLKDIKSSVGAMNFAGFATIENTKGGKNLISLELDSKELLLDTFLPKEPLYFYSRGGNKKQIAWSKGDINLSTLTGFDAKIQIKSEKAEIHPLSFAKFLLAVDLKDNNLSLSAASDDFYKGTSSVTGSLSFVGEPTAKININVDKAKIDAPLFNSKNFDISKGTVSLKADLTMLGKNMYTMFTNANGTGNFKIDNGEFSGISINFMEKFHKLIAVENNYFSLAELNSEVAKNIEGSVDFVEFKGQLLMNNGLLRILDTGISIPRYETKADNIFANIKDWQVGIGIDFSLPKMEYPPISYSLKGDISAPKKEVAIKNFVDSLAKLSNENKEFAEAKARRNLSDLIKFIEDANMLYNKSKIYVDELKVMFSKDKNLSVIYDNVLDEYNGMESLLKERDELNKIVKGGVVSPENLAKGQELYSKISSVYQKIEQSRANTVSEAAKVTISRYAKDAMNSANAIIAILANNQDNSTIKKLSQDATENAVKAEVLVQKAGNTSDPDEHKKIQTEIVKIAVDNIKLEAIARDTIRQNSVNSLEKEEEIVKTSDENITQTVVSPEPEVSEKKEEVKLNVPAKLPEASNIKVEPEVKPKLKGIIKRN